MTSVVSKIIFVFVVISFPLSLSAEGEKEELNLRRIADNIKFQNGLQFYNLKKYQKSLQEFNEYLEIFINGTHRKEAHLHIAKIYFERQEYPRSIKAYQALYEESSHTEEGIEACFQVGICYQKMGNEKRAREIFNTIVRDYPDSNYSYKARIQVTISEITNKQKNR